MATHDSASSSSSSSSIPNTYDVFLNFRGVDTRNNFTGLLQRALKREGINVFMFNEELYGGEDISHSLLQAIRGSKISISVLSKGYADSRWCLMELAEIVDRYRFYGQLVLPIFFDVKPKDVRLQIGSFKQSFEKHEKIFDKLLVKHWKEALTVVGEISGYTLEEVNGYQPELVDSIIEWVLMMLSRDGFDETKNFVKKAAPSDLMMDNKEARLDVDEEVIRLLSEAANIEKLQVEIFSLGPKQMNSVGGGCPMQCSNGSFSNCMPDIPYKINGKNDLKSITSQHSLHNRNCNDNFRAADDVGSFTKYDVFLNFRGKDTRNNFTCFLYRALKNEGINVFMDGPHLCSGKDITPTLQGAIRGSKISISIFSEGYAESEWCLMELVEIVQCCRSNGQKILPIFFDVEPTVVYNQSSGSFACSFQRYKNKFDSQTIRTWKEALRMAGMTQGFELREVNGNQPKLADLIIDWVLKELRTSHLDDVKNSVDEVLTIVYLLMPYISLNMIMMLKVSKEFKRRVSNKTIDHFMD